jgi:hypothetical protein
MFGLVFLCSTAFCQEPKLWTIYIHMNGDNNLCSYAKKDLAELKSMDVSDLANIIVAYDCSKQNDSKLIELKGNKEIVLKTGEFDMGDYKFFAQTASEVFEKYPSEYKMIDAWDHGGSWKIDRSRCLPNRGVSWDDQSGHHITTVEMGLLMKEIANKSHIDILGYDACLMQGVETGYETMGYSDYILASQETEPGDGWNYIPIVKSLANRPTPIELGEVITDSYIAQYSSGATFSLISTKGLAKLIIELDKIAPEIPNIPNIVSIINTLPTYAYSENKDLGTFLSKLPRDMTKDALAAFDETIIYTKNTKPATGISIHLTKNPSSFYEETNFARDFRWYQMLKDLK